LVGLLGNVLAKVVFLVFVLRVVEIVVNNDSFFVADKNLRLCDFEMFDFEEEIDTVQNLFHFIIWI
jgi:hypothetical protein